MAELTIHDDRIRLRLRATEKLAGLMGDQEFRLGAVQDVRVEADSLAPVRGLRAPGLAIPGRVKIGTWRGRGRRSLVVARRGAPAVRLALAGHGVSEVVVSTPNAEAVAAAIRARLA